MSKKRFFSLGNKTTLFIIIAVAILGVVSVGFSYWTYRNSLETQLVDNATDIARTIGAQVLPESIDRYLETGEMDEEYYATLADIRKIVENNDVEYSVVTKPTEEGFYYVYDSDRSKEGFQLGDFQAYYPGDFLNNKENFLAGNDIDPIITNYEFGWLLSVLVPIKDDSGVMHGYVDLDISMNEIMEMDREFLLRIVILILLILAVISVLSIIAARSIIVNPINQLADVTSNFVNSDQMKLNDRASRQLISLKGMNHGDEIQRLYESVQKMEEDIFDYIDNLTAVTAEKERIGAELDVATKIQADMLPSQFPAFPDYPDIDIYAMMNPAKEVGGDFYDFFLIDKSHLALVIADVSGKGVPAALFMVIAKTLIKDRALQGGTPGEILEYVNNRLCENNKSSLFVTVWLAIIDLETGDVTTANAGHEYPAVKRKNGSFELLIARHSIALAAMEDLKFRNNELHLNEGDTLFVYTDGVTEATNTSDQLFGDHRLVQALNSSPSDKPDEILPFVKRSIDAFVGSAPQFDDITMLGFKLIRYRKNND